MHHLSRSASLAFLVLLAACSSDGEPNADPSPDPAADSAAPEEAPAEPSEPEWVALFDGESLDGWTPKITGHPAGENFANTFRVEDGVLRVAYDGYESFDGRFGHLFHEQQFSSYDLRIVYRFVGDQVPGGPGWAFRNSGVMLHGQTPESMGVDQNFPVSIEAQFLGQVADGGERSTANLCTPGTNVEMEGELVTDHCRNSTSATYRDDTWVTFEAQVRGNESIRHLVDGEVVLEYQRPQLDPRDGDAQALTEAGAEPMLAGGTISLQSESHPIEFKSVEIRVLD
ncbi:MAG: DUF1080 domain-containing protein [Planctomycetota bacterium]